MVYRGTIVTGGSHYRLIVACMLSGASRDRAVIVGWSTALRGQVINESLGQLPKKLAAGPRVLARTESSNHHAPNRGRNRVDRRTITGRSWGNFGTLEVSIRL
jgi:hypothetical protein